MIENTPQSVFDAIKNDDLALFSRLIDEKRGNISLCFGRFPILSLCYLYESKKILFVYENELYSVQSDRICEEPFEAYQKFKEPAKKSLRLYLGRDTVVSPAEMLAVLKKSEHLKAVYFSYASVRKEKTRARIVDIYRLTHGETVVATEEEFLYASFRLPKMKRITFLIVLVLATVMLTGSVLFEVYGNRFFGENSEENPFNIYHVTQFTAAIENDVAYLRLMSDLTLPADWEAMDFSGNLDGNGHTLTVPKEMSGPFLKEISGTITGLNLSLPARSRAFTENGSLLFAHNKGILRNITVRLDATLTATPVVVEEGTEKETFYVSLFVQENSGQIVDCTLDGTVEMSQAVQTTKEGAPFVSDFFLSSFVSYNTGTLSRCFIAESTVIKTDCVDLSGLVAENAVGGTVSYGENRGTLSQITDKENWAPNTVGIAMINNGRITNAKNSGTVTAASEAEFASAYAAGIVLQNNGTVSNAENTGTVTAKAPKGIIYAGGITLYNSATLSNIKNSGAVIAKVEEGNAYAGGISMQNSGTIFYGRNEGEISVLAGKATVYGGGIVALNNTDTATVTDCISFGKVTGSAEGDLVIVGGIAGFSIGTVKNCLSGTELILIAGESAVGGIVGGVQVSAVIIPSAGFGLTEAFILERITNNYYAGTATNGVSLSVLYEQFSGRSYMETRKEGAAGAAQVASVEELYKKETYWE